MTVATPDQPNYASDTGTAYPAKIDAGFAAQAKIGWAFAPYEQTSPNMTLRVAAGSLLIGGQPVAVAAQSSATISAPSVNPRIDLAALNPNTGAVAIFAGSEAASPSDPSLPDGFLPVARITLATSTAAITNSIIEDLRALWSPPRLGVGPRQHVLADMLGDIAFLNKIAQGQIDAGAVQTADIAALAITSALLGGGAVTGPKLSAGMVVNFGYAVKSSVFTLTGASSNVFTDITDLSVTMAAPRDANSSYLIFGVVNVGDSGGKLPMLRLVDGSGTAIGVGAAAGSREQASTQVYTTNSNAMIAAPLMGRHAPASVSAQTIKAQIRTQGGGDTVYVNQSGTDANAGTTGRGFSMLAVAEIAG